MIPAVFAQDAVFAVLALALHLMAQSKLVSRLTGALVVYVLIEAAFHVPMENAAAVLMGLYK